MTRSAVIVRVPGSTSNLGSGFDFAGMAVDRWLRVSVRSMDGQSQTPVAIERHGTLDALTGAPEEDLIYRGFEAACRAAQREVPGGLAFTAQSDIPVSRGLGSSAAAIVAGAAAANTLLDLGLGPEEILSLGTDIEGHPDNVAPAIYGGPRLIVRQPAGGLLTTPLDVHASLVFAFAVPEFMVETKRARAVLPASLPHATAVQAAARSAALVRGLATADEQLIAAGTDDLLHVPYRRALVSGYDAVTGAARDAGAYGATLSGSGPTVVAIAPFDRAPIVAAAMVMAWEKLGTAADGFVSTSCVHGFTVTEGS